MAQGPGGGVARVGEGLATGFPGTLVEPLEARLGHIDLAAYLQHRRPACAAQFERDIAHRAHVGGDVLTGAAVAPGGAPGQYAVLVQQADRQAIQLGLAAVGHLGSITQQIPLGQIQCATDTPVEVAHVRLLEGVAEAEHGYVMLHLAKGRGRRSPYPLGG